MGFVLRVDDVGWVPPEKRPDVDMWYFRKWREALGLEGHPVYYGVIPEMVTAKEIQWLGKNLTGSEELAVHGYDHVKGAEVEAKHMDQGLRHLNWSGIRCRSYIPPFNEYTPLTISDWGRVRPNSFFFGGFDNAGLIHNSLPKEYKGGHFLPAIAPLYNHSDILLENIPKYFGLDLPLVVTMHATWGVNRLDLVKQVGEMLKPHLVPIHSFIEWTSKSRAFNRQRLTAPHFLAYKWIIDRLSVVPDGLGMSVLDFGARYSMLPSFLALRGCRVTAVDRDERIHHYQQPVMRNLGASTVKTQHAPTPEQIEGTYDAIVCCWALQHNLPAEAKIPPIIQVLSQKLRPKGRLLVVGSFSPTKSFEQRAREDPQTVLDGHDHQRLIIEPSGLKMSATAHFRYEHGTDNGDYCVMSKANAICYELVKQ